MLSLSIKSKLLLGICVVCLGLYGGLWLDHRGLKAKTTQLALERQKLVAEVEQANGNLREAARQLQLAVDAGAISGRACQAVTKVRTRHSVEVREVFRDVQVTIPSDCSGAVVAYKRLMCKRAEVASHPACLETDK